MSFTDIDMLQDYEKDARMAVMGYAIIQTEVTDDILRKVLRQALEIASESQQSAANLILSKGDRN